MLCSAPVRFLPLLLVGLLFAAPARAQTERSAHADRPTPVLRAHAPWHPARPPASRQPHLPLPPPLPNAEAPAPTPAAAKPAAAPAKPAKEEEKHEGAALPIPRFAALRTDDVNMRAGPGFRYPIEWVYKRRDLPMEIEREFEVWRLVLAPDGARGWVHEATLTGRRTFLVQDKEATLRAEPREDAAAAARLEPGVIGRIRSCDAGSAWCRVQAGNYGGFIERSQIWGVLPNEVVHAP